MKLLIIALLALSTTPCAAAHNSASHPTEFQTNDPVKEVINSIPVELLSVKEYGRYKYAGKGTLNLRIGFPYATTFYFSSGNEGRFSAGFIGASLGLDYFYAHKMFLNITGAGVMDFIAPVPVPIDYGGMADHMYSVYGTLSNNHLISKNRFSFGYGVSFGLDGWNTVNHGEWSDDVTQEEIDQKSIYRKSTSLGLVFPFYYYTKRSFYIGFVYRPTLVQFADKTRFKYQHTASIDFGWRIRLKR